MDLVAASIIAFITFGAPLGAAAWWLSNRPWKQPVQIFALCLSAIVLWVPALLLGALISEMLPLDWGHASLGYFVGYFFGSILSAAVVIARFVTITGRGHHV